MKTLIVAVNSQYIHSNLAVWYLHASFASRGISVDVAEYSINQQVHSVYMDIIKRAPNIICFSVYIWNIEFIKKLSSDIKKVMPNVTIILGGPEITYNSRNILLENPHIDFCICGAGENVLVQLVEEISAETHRYNIQGINYIKDSKFIDNGISYVDFKHTKSPYTDEMLSFCDGKIFYYESSRGCPFKCSYCLSSCESGVQYLELDRVFSEISAIVNAGYKLIKFVDRTFNANSKRAYDIVEFIINNTGDTVFHFEIGADLLTDELISLLLQAPVGKIQLEAGIQTTNEDTLCAINRKTDMDKLFSNVIKICQGGNIHMHVDLIAGLPYESLELFEKSFNDVYNLRAHDLQLGFLKLLHGTELRKTSNENGYLYRDYTPYEFLRSRWMSYEDVIEIKHVERVLELFGNGGKFVLAMRFLEKHFDGAYKMYKHIAKYMNLDDRPFSLVNRYGLMVDYVKQNFAKDILQLCLELMRFDFRHACIKNDMPSSIKDCGQDYPKLVEMFEESGLMDKLSIENRREMNKRIYIEKFKIDPVTLSEKSTVIAFDYKSKSLVTGFCDYYILGEFE